MKNAPEEVGLPTIEEVANKKYEATEIRKDHHLGFRYTINMDYGTRKAASSATGFIDGVGYIGAALTGILSGWLTDVWGWDAAFYLWIGASIFAGGLMLLLWNYKSEKREYE